MNRAAFTEVGFSRGNFYNTYCNARVTLADGRVYVFGGHDMQSSNGLYKVTIFDPETETWAPRRIPCTRQNWQNDPFGAALFAADPTAPFYPGCDQRDIQSTQPSEPSDQKYARWYPSAVALPDHTVLVVGGFDQDASVGPDPEAPQKAREQNMRQTDAAFTATRVNQVVPEVYGPRTDRNVALENARMAFPLYPQLEVVQTGPSRDHWTVCTMNGERDYGPETQPGGTKFGTPGAPGFERGTTWCLDVPGAMKDPRRDVAGKRHWTLLDTSSEVRPYCCPTASLVEPDATGRTVSHQWLMISGRPGGSVSGTVEMIDFMHPRPRWKKIGELPYPLTTTKAIVLPDGKVLIGHGLNRNLPSVGDDVLDFERREGLRFQMFDPATGDTTPLARTTVSPGLHGTATLRPNGSVFFAGENREALVRPNDPSFPMIASYGSLPAGDPDQGVPVGQVFRPPYFFQPSGENAARPGRRGRTGRNLLRRRLRHRRLRRSRRDCLGRPAAQRSQHAQPHDRRPVCEARVQPARERSCGRTAGDRAAAAGPGRAGHLHAVRRGWQGCAERGKEDAAGQIASPTPGGDLNVNDVLEEGTCQRPHTL